MIRPALHRDRAVPDAVCALCGFLVRHQSRRDGCGLLAAVRRVTIMPIVALPLILGSFLYFAHFSGAPPGATYVPAHIENGKFVPGTTK